jgi:hypothetical protein
MTTVAVQHRSWSGSCVACESSKSSGVVVRRLQIATALTILPFAKIPAQKSLLHDMKFPVPIEGDRGKVRSRPCGVGGDGVTIGTAAFRVGERRSRSYRIHTAKSSKILKDFDVTQFWLRLAQLFSGSVHSNESASVVAVSNNTTAAGSS